MTLSSSEGRPGTFFDMSGTGLEYRHVTRVAVRYRLRAVPDQDFLDAGRVQRFQVHYELLPIHPAGPFLLESQPLLEIVNICAARLERGVLEDLLMQRHVGLDARDDDPHLARRQLR